MDSLRLLTTMSWLEVQRTGGSSYGGKVGLGYTTYPGMKVDGVSEDILLSGFRVSDRFRIYGFQLDYIFYVIMFDPFHDIMPSS